jgi:quercetin dioxygenase-like cupin family protein
MIARRCGDSDGAVILAAEQTDRSTGDVMNRFYLRCIGILAAFMAVQAAAGGITPLKDAPFAQDEDVKCLESALETGNPETGPSTFILKAPAGCRVPAHYHSAQEQLIVIRGSVMTGMKGMHSATLTAGGFAVMPGKAIHWFSCEGKDPCLMVVTFDQKYDIVWVDAHSKP